MGIMGDMGVMGGCGVGWLGFVEEWEDGLGVEFWVVVLG